MQIFCFHIMNLQKINKNKIKVIAKKKEEDLNKKNKNKNIYSKNNNSNYLIIPLIFRNSQVLFEEDN
jgi:hypothetical protein